LLDYLIFEEVRYIIIIPVIINKNSRAGLAYSDCIGRFLGEEIDLRFINTNKKGIFGKLFGGR
jgi:septum site-determining protein MinD